MHRSIAKKQQHSYIYRLSIGVGTIRLCSMCNMSEGLINGLLTRTRLGALLPVWQETHSDCQENGLAYSELSSLVPRPHACTTRGKEGLVTLRRNLGLHFEQ